MLHHSVFPSSRARGANQRSVQPDFLSDWHPVYNSEINHDGCWLQGYSSCVIVAHGLCDHILWIIDWCNQWLWPAALSDVDNVHIMRTVITYIAMRLLHHVFFCVFYNHYLFFYLFLNTVYSSLTVPLHLVRLIYFYSGLYIFIYTLFFIIIV